MRFPWIGRIAGLAAAVLMQTGAGLAQPAPLPVVTIGTLENGTVNWELRTIQDRGFDRANGFELRMQPFAGNPATQVAMQGGQVDAIVSDWIWVAVQRANGAPFTFWPYSTAVGGLLVPADSPARRLEDLEGERIGIAGGPVDKSWLILRAYAQQEYGFDLAAETEQVFGAPPLIFETALSGETQGAINFWHFGAKMKAAGMRELVSVADAAQALGLNPDTPLLGYVVRGEMLADNPDLVYGMMAASRAAKNELATNDEAFERLRERMNAKNDEQFAALKDGFLAGTPAEGPVDEAAAARLLDVMIKLGGEELVGAMTSMPEGVFVQPRG